jgi:predicted ATP-grasp superfamily ATP-dependent carboligase
MSADSPSSSDHELPLAVICGASATGLGVGRDLGRRGVSVVFADYESFRPGFASRYVSRDEPGIVAESESDLIEKLRDLGRRQTVKPVLFQTTDQLVLSIAQHREQLGQHYHIADSTRPGIADVVTDKKSFYELCVKHGVVSPRTVFPATLDEALTVRSEFDFPVIIKPIHGHLWRERLKGRKLLTAATPDEFEQLVRKFADDIQDLMIQEMIPGPESNLWVGGLYLRQSDGEPGTIFTGRKLRQHPPGFGSASLADACQNDDVVKLSVSFLQQIGYRGVCGTEFKFDERDSQYKMVEVNPRQTLWFALIDASGIPLNYYAYCDLAGLPLPDAGKLREGTKWILFEKDLITSIRYILRGQLGFFRWLGSFRNVRVHAVMSMSDRRPMVSTLRTYGVRIWQRFIRRS